VPIAGIREIMLFIGKPKGRSKMISNPRDHMKKGKKIPEPLGHENNTKHCGKTLLIDRLE